LHITRKWNVDRCNCNKDMRLLSSPGAQRVEMVITSLSGSAYEIAFSLRSSQYTASIIAKKSAI